MPRVTEKYVEEKRHTLYKNQLHFAHLKRGTYLIWSKTRRLDLKYGLQ